MRFELAAVYRDQLRAIEKVREEQRVVTIDDVDRDVLGFYREGDLVEIALLYVRAGKLADVATFSDQAGGDPRRGDRRRVPRAALRGVARRKPARTRDPTTLRSCSSPTRSSFRASPRARTASPSGCSERAGHKVVAPVPEARAPRRSARDGQRQRAPLVRREAARGPTTCRSGSRELQERLRLPTLPRRIECCDISHLGGGDTVGAVVAMLDGELDKKHYRTFNVRGDAVRDQAGQINDDYGAMYEVLARRFRRAIVAPQEGAAGRGRRGPEPRRAEAIGREGDWDLPDLFVVDGGRGQLAVALAAAHDLGLHELPIVALAKEREGPSLDAHMARFGPEVQVAHASAAPAAGAPADAGAGPEVHGVQAPENAPAHAGAQASLVAGAVSRPAPGADSGAKEKLLDRVYLPGQKNPIPLRSSTTSLFLLARLRDEAHRFSNRARMRLGKKRTFASPLDDVKGLGGKAKKALLTHIGNLAAIRAADDATLLAVPGITSRHVRALRAAFPSSP